MIVADATEFSTSSDTASATVPKHSRLLTLLVLLCCLIGPAPAWASPDVTGPDAAPSGLTVPGSALESNEHAAGAAPEPQTESAGPAALERTVPAGTGSRWSLEPAVHVGWVYEFTELVQDYYGFEVAAAYTPGRWTFRGRYRADQYVFPYFGITRETYQQVVTGQPLTGPFLTRTDTTEERVEQDLLAGRRFQEGRLEVLAGARLLALRNGFSSMTSTGPEFQVLGNVRTAWGGVAGRLDGVWYLHNTIDNHRQDYVLPDGERTISSLGEPRYEIGWAIMVSPFSGFLERLSFGYDGSLLGLKHGSRYYNGLSLRAAF